MIDCLFKPGDLFLESFRNGERSAKRVCWTIKLVIAVRDDVVSSLSAHGIEHDAVATLSYRAAGDTLRIISRATMVN